MKVLAATAVAHPNIALAKYWGKRPIPGNYPAVPSLSVTLDGMATRTTLRFDPGLRADRFVLGNELVVGRPLERLSGLLDEVRAAAGFATRASVVSANDFPTASGLASSASGFAALALAAVTAAGLDWSPARVSDLARRASASAGRSVYGGYVRLAAGPVAGDGSELLAAEPVAPASVFPMKVVVCVTHEGAKSVASTDGMVHTTKASPFYDRWLGFATENEARLRDALLANDFAKVGELAEASALAMHASALAAGVSYFNGATLEILKQLRLLRDVGLHVYGTIDAGPHVKVLVRPDQEPIVTPKLRAITGVVRTIVATPGGEPRVERIEGAS
jgi:diphosphomevalonate decarboxylase